MKKLDRMYTVLECAERLRVDPRTIRLLIRRKKLRAVKVGREYRIPESALNAFVVGE